MENKNIYIDILKIGSENFQGFTKVELEEKLKEKGYDFSANSDYEKILVSIFYDAFVVPGHGNASMQNKNVLKMDAYFNYLEYVELQEARQSAKEAKSLSIKALWISAILAGASILLSIISICFQINGSLKINDSEPIKIIQVEREKVGDIKKTK